MTIMSVVRFLTHAFYDLADLPGRVDRALRGRIRNLFFRPRGAILPAEVRKELERVMLARLMVLLT
jgi:hypothetical protein